MENALDMDFGGVFGEAGNNTQKSNKQYLRAKGIKVGEKVIARVIPPFKSNKSKGIWAQRHSIHWGYKRSNPQDENGTPWMFNFRCVEVWDFQAKKAKQACPQCVVYEQNAAALKTLSDEIEAKVKKSHPGKEPTKDDFFQAKKADPKWVQLSAWIKNFNCDRKYYLAVKFLDGTFGNLVIGATGFEDLKTQIDALGKTKTIDPREGCYFEFTKKNDSNGRPKYYVQPYTEDVQTEIAGEIQTVQLRKKAPLTKEDLPKIEKFCMDLQNAHTAYILTVDQVQRLVDEGEGNPEVGAELHELAKDTIKNVVELDETTQPTPTPTPQSPAKPAPKAVAKPKPQEEDHSGMEALRKATKHKTVAPVDVDQLVEDDLIKHLQQ